MDSRVKLLGHPIHPMLVVFPLGLLGAAVVFDLVHAWLGFAILTGAAYVNMAAGIVAGLAAAVFGLIDWLAIPAGTRAKRIGLMHAAANVTALALFAVSWYARPAVRTAPTFGLLGVEVGALVIALVGGWLGGELVDR